MSLKKELQREIANLEVDIEELEDKRMRSMSQLLECLISMREPTKDEVQFFRQYNKDIDKKRLRLKKAQELLKRQD
ncbi:MAG: hypothetical protein J1F33_05765 [Clostridiales bacterium]|nr:hypothetical protein [Clostridiales bacterium]